MDKLDMQTKNLANEKFEILKQLFPNAVTETIDVGGGTVRAIDKDILEQEISTKVVEGRDERYQFTWPDKRKAILNANAPISKTLRPCREESVNFDETENLYIEGDNLEVLKLLQETYLGKIKMIYIDPPYNTGSDFVYNDDFKQSTEEYLEDSGQFDEEGNRLEKNLESNGRFHTDWLNMMYPRLQLARNLLSDDGAIFISISEKELANLRKICDEIFGADNFIEVFSWQKTSTPSNLSYKTKKSMEYIITYEKLNCGPLTGLKKHSKSNNGLMNQSNKISVLTFPKEYTETSMKNEKFFKGMYRSKSYDIELLNDFEIINGKFTNDIILKGKFKWTQDYLENQIRNGTKIYIKSNVLSPSYDKEEYDPEKPWNIIDFGFGVGTNENASEEIDKLFITNFSEKLYPKPVSLISYLISMLDMQGELVLDFFSGSSTTAQAVTELNAEDGGNRKFIMVQLPEETDEKSEAFKAGYKTIAEIGKERIRRAGKKILEENKDKEGIENLDIGFRVLKTDTSNMKDVYYSPSELTQADIEDFTDNIKEDRTAEDLVFQVMLDLGVPLSSKIKVEEIDNKEVYIVDENFLIACFDEGVSETTVKEIANKMPYYAVFRDSSISNDSVATNFDQIFESISPETIRKVI